MNEQKRAVLFPAVSSPEQAKDEKASLEAQEAFLRGVGERDGWEVVDVLRVPGFSRVYFNWYDFAEAAMHEGHDAGHKMLEHWRRRDFDILAVYDASRLAREQGILAEAVSRTIDAGARLYSSTDGYINAENHRMFTAMAGYRVSAEIDMLVKRRDFGMQRRAEKGLPGSPRPFWTHIIIRDEKGKAVRVELDTSKQRLYDDLAALILEGVPMSKVAIELFERFGHANPTTHQPYHFALFNTRVHNPAWWGHSARKWAGVNNSRIVADLWALGAEFEAQFPPPEGAQLWRNVLPPVWTGELAERIKAELYRRRTSAKGRAFPNRMEAFAGVFVCDVCAARLIYVGGNQQGKYLWCSTRRHRSHASHTCENKRGLHETAARNWFNEKLGIVLNSGTVNPFVSSDAGMYQRTLDTINKDLAKVQAQMTRVISLSTDAPEDLLPDLKAQLTQLTEKRRALRQAHERATLLANADTVERQYHAIEDIRNVGLEQFWKLPSNEINQLLHRLLADRRIPVRDGVILEEWTIPQSTI